MIKHESQDPDDLPPDVKKLAAEATRAVATLLDDYGNIHVQARENVDIDIAGSLRDAERRFNAKHPALQRVDELLGPESSLPSADQDKLKRYLADQLRSAHTKYAERVETSALDQQFHKRFLPPMKAESTQIGGHVTNRESLIRDLIRANPGVALADIHSHPDVIRLLGDGIPMLAQEGVDTVYLEDDHDDFQYWHDQSTDQLRQHIEEIGAGTAPVTPHRREIATFWLAARENDIRVVNIDKPGPARLYERVFTNQRVATTNFQWTDQIIKDREIREGKYIVFAGIEHFRVNHRLQTNGLVDDALGIPTLAFRPLQSGLEFKQGDHALAPDFWIAAESPDYPDYSTAQFGGRSSVNDATPPEGAPATPQFRKMRPLQSGK
ncbi:MAG: hypothetical protein AAF628_36655 [Planctomycetota bacterium]